MRYKISTGVVLRAAKARGLTVSTMAIFEGASGAEIRIEPQPEGSRPDKPPMPFYALTGILVALMSDSASLSPSRRMIVIPRFGSRGRDRVQEIRP